MSRQRVIPGGHAQLRMVLRESELQNVARIRQQIIFDDGFMRYIERRQQQRNGNAGAILTRRAMHEYRHVALRNTRENAA